jgi:hypothetical protein
MWTRRSIRRRTGGKRRRKTEALPRAVGFNVEDDAFDLPAEWESFVAGSESQRFDRYQRNKLGNASPTGCTIPARLAS